MIKREVCGERYIKTFQKGDMKMSWLRKRAIKKFINNPNDVLIINPRFCEHIYLNGICSLCGYKGEK